MLLRVDQKVDSATFGSNRGRYWGAHSQSRRTRLTLVRLQVLPKPTKSQPFLLPNKNQAGAVRHGLVVLIDRISRVLVVLARIPTPIWVVSYSC